MNDEAKYSEVERTTRGLTDYPEAPDRIGGSRLPLSQQEKAIAELHATINDLAVRLKPIMTNVNDVDKHGEEQADSDKSPLAQQLEANNRGIHTASRNLRGLMERLEC